MGDGSISLINSVRHNNDESRENEVQLWLQTNPMHHIKIQMASDEHLNNTISRHLQDTERKEDRLFQINHYLSIIEVELRTAREKGNEYIDLKKIEEGKEILNTLWDQLREDYPELMGSLDSPIPPYMNLSKVTKDQAERVIDQFRNAQQRDQRSIDTIARTLKLAADLNELVGRMSTERAKRDEKSTMVRNQITR
jgi:hypothetical protein